ncbi:MAG: protein kinase domain-containing protein, partial [Gaiellaceae bacterium]
MPICTSCGQENPDGFSFCPACGASLEAAPDPDRGEPHSDQPDTTVTTATDPSSFAAGRYEVKKFLGEGGKKMVYLAHDLLLDRDVAFALIKTEGLDETSRTRVAREAQAMGRLGSHPHIVTVFDLGEEAGQPFMVTELMGGGDVEALVEDAPEGVPLEEAIGICVSVCHGLEFAHGKQLVHRDLKPGNVWLTADGVAKIGDFGLALAQDRSRLTEEGLMVGTVAYMPPEQALGGEVSLRSDLYSLGAMLYELVTGRPPFLGDSAVAVIGQHINTPPVAPSWHNAMCPKPLEALIMRLLAKDPGERPDSAADVREALESIDTTATEAPSGEQTPSLDRLAGGVFVGRQREVDELKAALENALSGRGRLTMLHGEPGIGKTRTALELATYAGLRRAKVLWGRCQESEGAPPYWPWVQAMRSYVREADAEHLKGELGAGAAVVGELVSDIAERIEIASPQPLDDPKQARFRLFDSITAFLKSAAERQPLALVLDDLHWADEGSLLLLEFVARELADARLLLLGTYRDVELTRRHPLSATLGELTRLELTSRIRLRGISREDVARFIETTAGISPPRELADAVHAQTEGNPLFVTEVVRLLVQEGQLTPENLAADKRWSVGIPAGVREVIGRRLDRLSERCNETLTLAAVLGRQFELGQLDQLVEDASSDRLLDVLDEALAARVIEELPDQVGRYQFTHALIQHTLAQDISTTRRVRLSAQIAQALEQLYGDEADARAAELAGHYAEAETILGTDKIIHYSRLAGERALAAHAFEEAIVHFERALAAKADAPIDEETAEILAGLARSEFATREMYELGETVARMSQAFEHFADSGELDRAMAVAAIPIPQLWTPMGIPEFVERALEIAPPDSVDTGRLLVTSGWSRGMHAADYEGACDAIERALAIAERHDDASLERWALVTASQVDWGHLRPQACSERAERARELAVAADDQRTEMVACELLARVAGDAGDLPQARAPSARALESAERLGELSWLVSAREFGAVIAMRAGDWQTARELTDEALALHPEETMINGVRAHVEHEVGAFEDGALYVERMLEVSEKP